MKNIELKEIVFISIDEWNNFNRVVKKNNIDKIFLDYKCFKNHFDFFNFIEDEANEDVRFVLCIHFFRNENGKGFKENLAKNIIPSKYSDIEILFVTSDNEDEVAKEYQLQGKIFRYDQFIDGVLKGNINTYWVKDLIKKKKTDKNLIFISHSSKDKQIAKSFVNTVLKLGLSVPKEDIFFTSDYSTSINVAEDIPDALKNALMEMTLFISIISKDYFKSAVCLNEMGAGWVKLEKNKNLQLLLPNVKFTNKEMGFINVQKLGIKLNDEIMLHKLFDDYHDVFMRYNPKSGKFTEQLGEFISSLDNMKTTKRK